MRIGYIGLGDMGGALATRLQSRHPLCVHDLNAAAVATLVGHGATAATSTAELACQVDVVLLCLPTSQHVRSLVLDQGGLLSNLTPGALVIDQTSGDPDITVALAEALAERKITLVDAPVSGGAAAALAGGISIMLGAEGDAIERASEVLRLISPNVVHVGVVGSGHTMKLVNNFVSCSQRLLSLEALALATKKGIAPETAVKVLAAGGARNAFFEQQADRILSGVRDTGFSVGLAHKDLVLACGLAASVRAPAFYASVTRELYQMAANRFGYNARVDRVADLVEEISAVELRTSAG